VLTRFASYAVGFPIFLFDELATIGHPVALRLRNCQIQATTDLWKRCCLPESDEVGRRGLPGRNDRKWFAEQVCGRRVEELPDGDAKIWPYASTYLMYDPLSVLAASLLAAHTAAAYPSSLERYFNVEIKVVNKVEHMVIGLSASKHGIRDVPGVRSFMMKAMRYALKESVGNFEKVLVNNGGAAPGGKSLGGRKPATKSAAQRRSRLALPVG